MKPKLTVALRCARCGRPFALTDSTCRACGSHRQTAMLAPAEEKAGIIYMTTVKTKTDCGTEDGITVGLIDSIILNVRLLEDRDVQTPAAIEALKDLQAVFIRRLNENENLRNWFARALGFNHERLTRLYQLHELERQMAEKTE